MNARRVEPWVVGTWAGNERSIAIVVGLVCRGIAAILVLSGVLRAAEHQHAEHVLRRDDFVVVVATATDRLESRYGPRFDRTAQVISVKVAGKEWLAPDGLPDEFAQQGDGLLGYGVAELAVFLKPGVGLLRADAEDGGRYFFAHPYAVEKRGEIFVDKGDDWLEARQAMPETPAGRLVLTKRYRLLDRNELEVRFSLSVSGKSDVYTTTHYNHHFFLVGEQAPDRRYRVEFLGLPPSWEARPQGFAVETNQWRLLERPSPERAWYVALEPRSFLGTIENKGAGFRLELPARGFVEFTSDGAVTKAAVWAGLEGFCPELFVKVAVPPGGEASWTQHYRFLERKDG